ncbi:hypothetical protein NE237_024117 [Protea cynaroides]|uniref:Diacylglycerol glucosyltransferase N-terminal domain-containing protein n=1 Tax=Protea cynaroides TaxID=273540 RepID=A0A9Q0HG92_9MAGN|nr:hypothetical protein NE237_024117 [Protea cynaroides]
MRSPAKSGDLNVLRYRQTDRVSSSSAIHFDIAGIVVIKEVWKEYAGWPLNDMERSYKFMVNYGQLWKVAFFSTSPRWIHCSYLAAMANIYAKEVETGLMDYKPDIIISVHPLMQHIPLWVLKWQGLQKKVVFVTIDIAEIARWATLFYELTCTISEIIIAYRSTPRFS